MFGALLLNIFYMRNSEVLHSCYFDFSRCWNVYECSACINVCAPGAAERPKVVVEYPGMVTGFSEPPWGAKNWTLVLCKRPPFLKNSFNAVLSKNSIAPELAILIVLSIVIKLMNSQSHSNPSISRLQNTSEQWPLTSLMKHISVHWVLEHFGTLRFCWT